MFFKKKKPKRLYVPTKSKWYNKPRRKTNTRNSTNRKLFSKGFKSGFSRVVKDAFMYVVGAGLLIGAIVFFLFSNKFSIDTIEIARNDLYIDNVAVSKALKDYRGTSIFTFSKPEAKALIKDSFPEFETIEIKRILPNKIKVELKSYDVIANVSVFYTLPEVEANLEIEEEEENPDDPPEVEASNREEITPIEQKALLNSIGQVLLGRDENPELMTITIEGLTQPIKDKEFVIEPEHMEFITNSIKYLSNTLQMEVASITYYPIAHEVHLTTPDDLTLWLITKKDYKKQLDRFHTIYNLAEMRSEDIAYFDLRVNEKIIYCPRGQRCDK